MHHFYPEMHNCGIPSYSNSSHEGFWPCSSAISGSKLHCGNVFNMPFILSVMLSPFSRIKLHHLGVKAV